MIVMRLNSGQEDVRERVFLVSVVQDTQVPGDYLVFQHCSGWNVDPVSVVSDDNNCALKHKGNITH